jgi:hypothetical protein
MHLRGPWEFEILADETARLGTETSTRGMLRLPISWQEAWGDFRGTVRFLRRFHAPTNLDPHERVFVVFDGVGGSASVSANEKLLGSIPENVGTAEFEITPLLAPNNQLVVELRFLATGEAAPQGGLWGPVALEIRSE